LIDQLVIQSQFFQTCCIDIMQGTQQYWRCRQKFAAELDSSSWGSQSLASS
jgi:hypothetical protein